ncbi:MAG: substrate-binding domain-containing protein [Candidatus Eisenbacteria bacterium]|uniref:Substrate-binding domain-containing protein n=1 Tax=Eiseniibacteriota bacterium TaxID=2212470 RepID=A0A933W8G4_UNCEI|nr:substrate-binding domain-containing protein [Candidatus Eisenbacteria bacterium]
MEDSQTSGSIQVVVVPELRAMLERQVEAFTKMYPDARFTLRVGSSREAVSDLLSQRADLAVVARELEPEERTVPVEGGMEIEGYRFARDGICIVVHPSNPLESVSVDDLHRIYSDLLHDWSELHVRAGAIEPVVQEPNGDLMMAFCQRVLGGASPTAPAYRASSDSAVIERVRRTPGAIGMVSMASSQEGVRRLRVSALRGLPDWNADAEKVYKGEYPLVRNYNMYLRTKGPMLSGGLITFVSTRDGQKLVYEAGAVPMTVPVRFARRSPMLGSH